MDGCHGGGFVLSSPVGGGCSPFNGGPGAWLVLIVLSLLGGVLSHSPLFSTNYLHMLDVVMKLS